MLLNDRTRHRSHRLEGLGRPHHQEALSPEVPDHLVDPRHGRLNGLGLAPSREAMRRQLSNLRQGRRAPHPHNEFRTGTVSRILLTAQSAGNGKVDLVGELAVTRGFAVGEVGGYRGVLRVFADSLRTPSGSAFHVTVPG